MFRILGVAFIGVVCFLLIKHVKPDFAPFLLIAVGVVILVLLSDPLAESVSFLVGLSEKAGIDSEILSSLLKIIGIGYLTEYSVSICDDCGCASIGKKIEFAGKIMILLMTIPIFKSIIDRIGALL